MPSAGVVVHAISVADGPDAFHETETVTCQFIASDSFGIVATVGRSFRTRHAKQLSTLHMGRHKHKAGSGSWGAFADMGLVP